jgi:cytochrome c peroxidase
MSEKTKFLFFTVALALVAIVLFSIGWGKMGGGFESADKPPETQYKYVGSARCMTCHTKEGLGGQFEAWIESKHSRSYLVLGTGCPKVIEEEAKSMVEVGHGKAITREAMRLGENIDCLKCHATAADVDTSFWEPTFHFEDGVQCETCHGPGSGHVAKMMKKKGQSPPNNVLLIPKMPTKEDCMVCHKEKPSHAVLKSKPFNFEKTWKEIAHPMPKKGRK